MVALAVGVLSGNVADVDVDDWEVVVDIDVDVEDREVDGDVDELAVDDSEVEGEVEFDFLDCPMIVVIVGPVWVCPIPGPLTIEVVGVDRTSVTVWPAVVRAVVITSVVMTSVVGTSVVGIPPCVAVTVLVTACLCSTCRTVPGGTFTVDATVDPAVDAAVDATVDADSAPHEAMTIEHRAPTAPATAIPAPRSKAGPRILLAIGLRNGESPQKKSELAPGSRIVPDLIPRGRKSFTLLWRKWLLTNWGGSRPDPREAGVPAGSLRPITACIRSGLRRSYRAKAKVAGGTGLTTTTYPGCVVTGAAIEPRPDTKEYD